MKSIYIFSIALLTIATSAFANPISTGSLSSVKSAQTIIRPKSFVYPLLDTRVSSDFGDRTHPVLRVKKHHNGADLAAPNGAPFRSIANGVVVWAGDYKAYGNLIVVKHDNGFTSHYGHCQSIKAQIGKTVRAGEILGLVGQTGRVTGPHLHFEIRKDGKPLDPEAFIPGFGKAAEG